MSDNENQPLAPSKQTSSIPLKKETIRVTLKASDAAPAVPSATVSMAPSLKPPTPTGPPLATVGPPTVSVGPPTGRVGPPTASVVGPPMASGGPPTASGGPPRPSAPAPTIPLRSAGAPNKAPAPTIRLAGSAAPTGAVRPPGAATLPAMGLPKATVQLVPPTHPLGTNAPTSHTSTISIDEEEEEEAGQGLSNILSGVGLAAALIVLAFQLMTAGTWVNAEDNERKGDWTQLSPL